jgi:parallel beta-helix repeat protein
MKINNKLKLAAAIAAGIALVGCGSEDEATTSVPRDVAPTTEEIAADAAETAAAIAAALPVVLDCSTIEGGARTIDIAQNVIDNVAGADSTFSDELSQALETAQSCDTIELPAGLYDISSPLTFDGIANGDMVTNVTVIGAGMPISTTDAANVANNQTALDFSSSLTGDGFNVTNTKNITFEKLGVYEAENNAIKLKDVDGIVIREVATVWETEYDMGNGAYGLYPVETSNVLIEDSYVEGSADAGIYVGQSENIIVRNNVATKNVAGIEIENSKNADVYGNTATLNTGGVLIFDLPIGNGIYGSGVRIFDNTITSNNAPNFAVIGGSAAGVHIVPPGTGMIILSTSDVEIYNNTITDNETMAIAITSFLLPDPAMASAPDQGIGSSVFSYDHIHPYASVLMDGYSPLVRGISIHDNTISQATSAPAGALIADVIGGMGMLQTGIATAAASQTAATNEDIAAYVTAPKMPDILYDGIGQLIASTPNPGGDGESIFEAIAGGINQLAVFVYTLILEPSGATDPVTQIADLTAFSAYTDTAADRICQFDNGNSVVAGSGYGTSYGPGSAAAGHADAKMTQLGLGALDITAAGVYQTTATAETFNQDIVDALDASDDESGSDPAELDGSFSAPLTKMEIAAYYNALVDQYTADATAALTAAGGDTDDPTYVAAAALATSNGEKVVEFFTATLTDDTMDCTGITPYVGPQTTVTFNGDAQTCATDLGSVAAPAGCPVTTATVL